jgi:site-specific recombinase XerD
MENFIQYLQSKNHAISTQNAYLINLNLFLKWTEKEAEQTTKKDVLKYLEHLQTKKAQGNITRRNSLIAINHYFTFLQQSEQITTNPAALIKIRGTKKKHLYRTYTPEELEQLFDNYYQLFVKTFDNNHIPKNQRQNSFLSRNRNAAILSLLIYQGLKTREIDQMLLEDIDLVKATVKIRGGNRKGNERTLPLKATQIGLLMHYVNHTRPQFFNHCAESEKLFFALPASGKANTKSQNLMHTFKPLIKQLKSIDRNFLDFRQVRASVITNWLKNEGLRKAQYMAGHKSINATEEYLPNQIEGLTEDIGKFNPF